MPSVHWKSRKELLNSELVLNLRRFWVGLDFFHVTWRCLSGNIWNFPSWTFPGSITCWLHTATVSGTSSVFRLRSIGWALTADWSDPWEDFWPCPWSSSIIFGCVSNLDIACVYVCVCVTWNHDVNGESHLMSLLFMKEAEFNGVQGFETLLRRLKEGKRVIQDFEDFLKARYFRSACPFFC